MKKKTLLAFIIFWTALMGAPENETIEKEFSQYHKGDKIAISMKGDASIDITGSKESGVLVKIDHPEEYNVIFKANNNLLSLKGDYTKSPILGKKSVQVNIQLPYNFDIEVNSDGGTITLTDLKGDFKCTTKGANINILRLQGKIDFRTKGGNISIHQASLQGKVQTSGGNIQISELEGQLNKKYDGEVKISSQEGDIHIDEARCGATVATKSGDISIKKANDYVKAFTGNGNIILRNIRGNIDAQTYSGNIDVEMLPLKDKEKKQSCNLQSKRGNVILYMPKKLEASMEVSLTYTKEVKKQFKIKSDFDLRIEETREWDLSKKPARKVIYGKGKTGSGDHPVHISTVNGNIHLREGKKLYLKNISFHEKASLDQIITYDQIQRCIGRNARTAWDIVEISKPEWLYETRRNKMDPADPFSNNYYYGRDPCHVYFNDSNLEFGDIHSLQSIRADSLKAIIKSYYHNPPINIADIIIITL